MISTRRIEHERYDVQLVQGTNELIAAPDMEEMEHITKIYAEAGYTIRSQVVINDNQYLAYIANHVFMLGLDYLTVIGFN